MVGVFPPCLTSEGRSSWFDLIPPIAPSPTWLAKAIACDLELLIPWRAGYTGVWEF